MCEKQNTNIAHSRSKHTEYAISRTAESGLPGPRPAWGDIVGSRS